MQRGYIKIWRKLEDSGLLQMHGTLALFMYMLVKATHKDIRVGMADLKRGQLSAGRHQLAEAVGMTEQQLRTCEKKLRLLGMIEAESTNKFTIYTIVNYNNYQEYEGEPNKQPTNEQQTDNKQLTTEQTHKHINTKEETKPTSAKSAISIKTFIKNCEDSGERRIPENDPVFEFADSTGISMDMVKVCWNHFVDTHKQNGKRQKDWRGTFRNCVKNNWYKLWFVEADGTVKETSQYRALKKGQPNV